MHRKIVFAVIISACWACSFTAIPGVFAGDCFITWSGYNYRYEFSESGSVLTAETSRTQQAALEARNAIFFPCSGAYLVDAGCNDECCTCDYGHYSIFQYYSVYYSGEYKETALKYSDAYPPQPPTFSLNAQGTWDVLCDNTTTTSATTSVPPTVVELSSFTATSTDSSIVLKWETESEANNAGFNVYRAETENGDYTKINSVLIIAKGSTTQGASYEYIDTAVQVRITYYYKLEDMDLTGTFRNHGPVHAAAGITETTTIPAGTTTTTAPAGQCAAETIYGEHSAETEQLREYRDTVLSKSETGRQLIRKYYELSPAVSDYLRKNEKARAQARRMLDSLMPAIREKLVK